MDFIWEKSAAYPSVYAGKVFIIKTGSKARTVQAKLLLAGTAPHGNSCVVSDVEQRLDRCADLKYASD